MKLNAKQLRITKPAAGEMEKITRNPIHIVLDNVLDTYNIGGLFRLADAVGAAELILCGGSETPPSSRIHKAAVGTEEWVRWRYFAKAEEAIKTLRDEVPGIKIIAVEQDERAVPLNQLLTHNSPLRLSNTSPLRPSPNLGEGNFRDVVPIALVVGHETDGVSKEALDMADVIVEIPMWGVNKSLNVIVSAAVAVYGILGLK